MDAFAIARVLALEFDISAKFEVRASLGFSTFHIDIVLGPL